MGEHSRPEDDETRYTADPHHRYAAEYATGYATDDDPDAYDDGDDGDDDGELDWEPTPRRFSIGREPTLIAGVTAAAAQLASAELLPFTSAQQGVINTAVVTVAALALMPWLAAERAAALLSGAAQAVIAAAAAYGLNLTQDQQGALMAAVSITAAAYLRTQVAAPVTATGDRHP